MPEIKNIKRAIEIGVCYVKPWGKKIRCFDARRGYGSWVDLTSEEYVIYQKVSILTQLEQLKRLNELIGRNND